MTTRLRLVAAACALAMICPALAAAADPAAVKTINIRPILDKNGIYELASDLRAMVADESGKHTAFYFVDSLGQYTLYKDGKKLGSNRGEQRFRVPYNVPPIFFFTKNGRLVYSLNGRDLWVDGRRISTVSTQNPYLFSVEAAVEHDGALYYPTNQAIMRYDLKSGKRQQLYNHPGKQIISMRMRNGHAYYTLKENIGIHLYKDGKPVVTTEIDNPWNFLITAPGDVYTFGRTSDDRYTVLKNGAVTFTGKGLGGFLFEEPGAPPAVWHVGYVPLPMGDADVSLYRNGTLVNTSSLGNIEGFMAFQNGHYAARAVSRGSSPENMGFLYDGKFSGELFPFLDKKDFQGVQFASDNSAYMRNWKDGRWLLYRNGTPILKDTFQNVWYFRVVNGTVRAYGAGL